MHRVAQNYFWRATVWQMQGTILIWGVKTIVPHNTDFHAAADGVQGGLAELGH